MARTIWLSRLVVLVAFLDLFIQFPTVAPYAEALGAGPALLGLIVAAYPATIMVGHLGAGLILDRWGRTRPMALGLVLTGVALLAYAAVSSAAELLAIRLVHGLVASVLTPGAFALLGDSAPPERRTRVMGVSGALIALAAVLGPPLATVLAARAGYGVVFLSGGALMLLTAALFGLGVREPARVRAPAAPFAPAPPDSATPRAVRPSYLGLWARRPLVTADLSVLALTVGLGALVAQLPLLLAAWGEPASRRGTVFSVFALVAMAVMASPAARRGGRSGMLGLGLALAGVSLLVMAVATRTTTVSVGMAVLGIGFGLLFPNASALVAEATAPEERGAAFGIFYAVYNLGAVLGSLATGLLDEWAGGLTAAPFVLAGIVALIAAPLPFLFSRAALVPDATPEPPR